ncbi:MAG TPA: hypothetical protein VKP30_03475, partial [Polyangiaceae bacterium]|nr:hypothetical protein [Polyangiaceae bacterium]
EITATSGASGSLAVKLLGAVLIAGAAAGGATYLVRGPGQAATTSIPSVSAGTAPNPVATEHLVENTSLQAATEPTATSSATAPTPAPEASTVRHRPVNRDNTTNATEATLLDAARAKLRTDPKRAVELTREHARRFPNGVLVQEREVIAIEALRRLGQDDAAKKRGEDFNQQYPDSAHQSKIGQTLKGN